MGPTSPLHSTVKGPHTGPLLLALVCHLKLQGLSPTGIPDYFPLMIQQCYKTKIQKFITTAARLGARLAWQLLWKVEGLELHDLLLRRLLCC